MWVTCQLIQSLDGKAPAFGYPLDGSGTCGASAPGMVFEQNRVATPSRRLAHSPRNFRGAL
jgi:hypothetical protein